MNTVLNQVLRLHNEDMGLCMKTYVSSCLALLLSCTPNIQRDSLDSLKWNWNKYSFIVRVKSKVNGILEKKSKVTAWTLTKLPYFEISK